MKELGKNFTDQDQTSLEKFLDRAELVEVFNSKGYVIKSIEAGKENQFGKTDIFTIEGGQYRITYESNVLHGVNYFKILKVTDYLAGRNYMAWRYFFKFISFIQSINSEIYLELKKEQWTDCRN